MSPRFDRQNLTDESFIDSALEEIAPDEWRPHGVRYRLAWIQCGVCRVLFDNHHGKADHMHVDGVEGPYEFTTAEKLVEDFLCEVRRLGGPV